MVGSVYSVRLDAAAITTAWSGLEALLPRAPQLLADPLRVGEGARLAELLGVLQFKPDAMLACRTVHGVLCLEPSQLLRELMAALRADDGDGRKPDVGGHGDSFVGGVKASTMGGAGGDRNDSAGPDARQPWQVARDFCS